jgi:hypothetical protein
MENLENFDSTDDITTLSAKQNYDFFEIQLNLKDKMDLLGECWIAIDTYDAALGESMMPNGQTIPSRSEFFLKSLNMQRHCTLRKHTIYSDCGTKY